MSSTGQSVRSPKRRVCEAPNLVPALLRSLDTRIGRQTLSDFQHGRHTELVARSIDPENYSNVDLFWRDYLAVSLLSKYPCLNLGLDTEAIALEKFRQSEAQCRLTNRRLLKYDTPTLGVSGESLIFSARQKILGLVGEFSWDDAEPFFGFTGGASTRLRRKNGDAYHKFQGKPETTRHAALLSVCAIWHSPIWRRQMQDRFGDDPMTWVTVVKGSRITTVPKNAKTDRTIAIEPCMNMYLQQGIGAVIRKHLVRVGVNLHDQTLNQRLARVGSLHGSLATIDLAAASDSISIELVRALMPPSWFKAMDLVRCEQSTFASGEVVTLQKFSSMGNGFTFELESLIFWALASACVDLCAVGDSTVAVYGDDIIVPTAAAGTLVELLDYCGFKCNTEKSFFKGPFRESCGKHYFSGVDVTPFYIRKPISSVSMQYWFCNSIRRWAARPLDGAIADPRFKTPWDHAVSTLRQSHRIFIPEDVGDVGLIGTFTECCPRRVNDTWQYPVWTELSGTLHRVHDDAAYIKALSFLGKRSDGLEALSCVDTSFNDLLVNRESRRLLRRKQSSSRWVDGPFWPSLEKCPTELLSFRGEHLLKGCD